MATSKPITVSIVPDKPSADFSITYPNLDGMVEVNNSVSFDGSLSSDPQNETLSYNWDFDDGNTASGKNVSNTFTSGGTYKVTLTVTDPDGPQDEKTKDVLVVGPLSEEYKTGDIEQGQQF